MAGEIPTRGFKKHYEPLFENKEQLTVGLKDLNNQLNELQKAKDSFDVIASKSLDFYNNWENLERGEKRFIVESITNQIIFDNKTIQFKLKKIAPLSSLELSANGQHHGTM